MKTKPARYSIEKIQREQENIDLDPFFQRGKVWTPKKKKLFIDTILRGWGIPKIYLAVTVTASGGKIRQCVDGKQRLSTILEFVENKKFKLNEKGVAKEFLGKNYEGLKEGDRDDFNEFKLDVEEITDFTDKELAELFQRLQLGTVLNSGEQLNAIEGGMIEFVRRLTRHTFLTKKISVIDTRYAFLAIAGQICLLEILGIKSAKFKDLKTLFENNKAFSSRDSDAKQIKHVLDYLNHVFTKQAPELSNRGSVVSAYLLISHLAQRGNIKGKQRKIRKFFSYFYNKLKKEINKNTGGEPDFLRYQTALLQAADSQKSILIRHQILLNKLANYDAYFKKLINTSIDEDDFKELYDALLLKYSGNFKKLELYFQTLTPKIKTINCARGVESIPTHIRHGIHHPEHKRYTRPQLVYALKLLNKIT